MVLGLVLPCGSAALHVRAILHAHASSYIVVNMIRPLSSSFPTAYHQGWNEDHSWCATARHFLHRVIVHYRKLSDHDLFFQPGRRGTVRFLRIQRSTFVSESIPVWSQLLYVQVHDGYLVLP